MGSDGAGLLLWVGTAVGQKPSASSRGPGSQGRDPRPICPVPPYLDELRTGRGQQVECAGKLPEEALPSLPMASTPHPLQELLQAGAGLDAAGPVEAAQRGAWSRDTRSHLMPRSPSQMAGIRPPQRLSSLMAKPLRTGLITVHGFPRPLACFWTPLWEGRVGTHRIPNAKTIAPIAEDPCSHPDPARGPRPAQEGHARDMCRGSAARHGHVPVSQWGPWLEGTSTPSPWQGGEPGVQRPRPFSEPVPPRSPPGLCGDKRNRKGLCRPHPYPGAALQTLPDSTAPGSTRSAAEAALLGLDQPPGPPSSEMPQHPQCPPAPAWLLPQQG